MKKLVLTLCAVVILMPAAAFAQQQPIRSMGDQGKAPERIKYVQPAYPEDAKAAHVSGIVVVEAVIGEDGSVTDAKIIRSIALLDEAALAAVRQWKYAPTTLNGQPVPVIMTVTVNFTLNTGDGMASSGGSMQSAPLPMTVFPEIKMPPERAFLNGTEVLRIGGDVKAPERTKYVQPVYPKEAQDAHVTGIVIIEAIIDETGHVAQTKVLRSVLGLDQAAVDAVMQWEYTPTLLNGVTVPVLMTVTVNFTMQ